ncbi:MAG: hypothetical protein Q9169_004566 [Polycauliona sp. 2 TL-2023]
MMILSTIYYYLRQWLLGVPREVIIEHAGLLYLTYLVGMLFACYIADLYFSTILAVVFLWFVMPFVELSAHDLWYQWKLPMELGLLIGFIILHRIYLPFAIVFRIQPAPIVELGDTSQPITSIQSTTTEPTISTPSTEPTGPDDWELIVPSVATSLVGEEATPLATSATAWTFDKIDT